MNAADAAAGAAAKTVKTAVTVWPTSSSRRRWRSRPAPPRNCPASWPPRPPAPSPTERKGPRRRQGAAVGAASAAGRAAADGVKGAAAATGQAAADAAAAGPAAAAADAAKNAATGLLDALNPFKKGAAAPPKPAAPPPQKAGPSREDTAKVKERCMAKVLILVDQGVITSGQVEKYYEEMVEDELSKLR